MQEAKEPYSQFDDSAPPMPVRMSDDDLENDIKQSLVAPSCIPLGLFALCVPCWCTGITILPVKKEKVLLSMGKYQGTLRKPGCYCVNPCCLTSTTISTAQIAQDLANVKVADAKGNPLLLSGVVTYAVRDARKAALDVDDYADFLLVQGTTVMKRVASMYPYEARGDEPSLKTEADHLRVELINHLQKRVNDAGIQVLNFELNDLAYAPEIAQQMLVRQQAEAVVDARKVIAHGAVEIVSETLQGLSEKGVAFNDSEASRLASNLVVIICGEAGAQPVMNVGTNSEFDDFKKDTKAKKPLTQLQKRLVKTQEAALALQ